MGLVSPRPYQIQWEAKKKQDEFGEDYHILHLQLYNLYLSNGRLYSSPGHIWLLPDDATIYSARLWIASDVDHTH